MKPLTNKIIEIMSKKNLDTGNKLMLLQGISLIENGLQFLEWMTDYANENSADALAILRDRFNYFKENALSEHPCDYLMIDRAKSNLENIQFGYALNKKVITELEKLRNVAIEELREYEKE